MISLEILFPKGFQEFYAPISIAAERDFSEETASIIDEEVRSLVDEAYRRAKSVLVNNRSILDKLAQMLVDKETVDSEELQELLATNDVTMASIA